MRSTQSQGFGRSRWAAIGAAVAVSLGAGGLAITNAATAPGGRSAFVPITPCRLFDTRPTPDNIGPRSTPLTAGETHVQQVTGANGNCSVPTDAVGIAFNVTAVNGTVASFLSVFPSDATRPLVSSLNWVANAPATPNKVDVKLSSDGKVSFFNPAGTVNVVADVVGYYVGLDGNASTALRLDPGSFSNDGDTSGSFVLHDFDAGRLEGANANVACGIAGVDFPQGATLTDVTAHVADSSALAGRDIKLQLWRNPIGVESAELIFERLTTGTPGNITLTGTNITTPLIDNTQYTYFVTVCGLTSINFLYDVSITFT